MRLTFSKLDTYRRCPLRFRFRYQERLPEPPLGRRNLSLILHRALEAFLSQARRDPSREALLRAYESRCPPPQTPQQAQRYTEGRRALESFHWQEGGRLRQAVALEQDFTVRVAGLTVAGRLDCALETELGLELVDFKFTQAAPSQRDPLQLQLYALGLQEVTRQTPDTLTYYYLRQEQRISFPGGDQALAEGRQRISALAQQLLQDQAFAPRPGDWCASCPYRSYCPAQQRQPLPLPSAVSQARLPL